ncbi:uncharacterized protein VTP21DRAFT_2040 [Calcarisporiella thermophila]|uniref:uncharacterized protein n=1 Tax=Calcarisporiella thermophila TaxID=911321 RepID=UPI00374367CC
MTEVVKDQVGILEESNIVCDANLENLQHVNSHDNSSRENSLVCVSETKKKRNKKKKQKSAAQPNTDLGGDEVSSEEVPPFDQTKTYRERVEQAVLLFKRNRKLNDIQKSMFDRFLAYIGFAAGQNTLQRNQVDTVESPIDSARDIDATQFEESVQIFLSEYLLRSGFISSHYFVEAPAVIYDFLQYLMTHNVCPEYLEDVQKASSIAKLACSELPLCKAAMIKLPGAFNSVCMALLHPDDINNNAWCTPEECAIFKDLTGMNIEEAQQLVGKVSDNKVENICLEEHWEGGLARVADIISSESRYIEHDLWTITLNSVDDQLMSRPIMILLESNIAEMLRPGFILEGNFYRLKSTMIWCAENVAIFPTYTLFEQEAE